MLQKHAHLSAPAHDNILLILRTWKGWTRTLEKIFVMVQMSMRIKTMLKTYLMWKESLPQFFTRYLLQQILAASRAW